MEVKRTRLDPKIVWRAWTQAHKTELKNGAIGHVQPEGKKGVSYEIAGVVPGVSFSTVWKSFLVRLVFEHTVRPLDIGSEVRYGFRIEGPLAWILRPLLRNKIGLHVKNALHTFIQQLESINP